MKVAIIGAAGHVGLPFSLVVANSGHDVIGIDLNPSMCDKLNSGVIPFIEEGADKLLAKIQDPENRYCSLSFTHKPQAMADRDVIAIMIGSPMDSEGNPRLDGIMSFVEHELCEYVQKGALIILRSTVSPGITELVKTKIQTIKKWTESVDFHLVFAPERVSQGHGIEESIKFPQLIGAFSQLSYDKAAAFFSSLGVTKTFFLTPKEAEFGKLMTNMYRYVNFALANEFYMIADKHDVNISKVIEAVNLDYPRVDIPKPGPNVGGPCLFKDGKFLTNDIPYADLIQNAFLINEGMPQFVFNQITGLVYKPRTILILGMTFKAENDDTRNSLSYKFKKICHINGVNTICVDPYLGYNDMSTIDWFDIDAVVVMTPHKSFINDFEKVIKKKCGAYTIISDIWKLFPDSQKSKNGIYELGEVL
jgi:UDP-N-acetyl-D-mannosaminuronic acid dehydrogenase